MRRTPDVVALIVGLLLVAVALGALWQSLVGAVNWHLVKVAAPFTLVAVGVLGLALSRHRR